MKMIQVLSTILLFIAAAVAGAENKPPEVDQHGLHLVHDSELRRVYKRPGVDIGQYEKVILVDVYVAFRKNWERDHRMSDPFRVNKRDVEHIKERVANEFEKEFTQRLEKKGYPVVDKTQTGHDVLIVRPAIINLDVVAPDTMKEGRSTTFTASAGQMTLYAELYDSVSNQLIATVLDPQADRSPGDLFMSQSRVDNRAAEGRIVRRWADTLAEHLHHTSKKP